MKEKITLKGLQSQLSQVEGEIRVLKARVSAEQQELALKNRIAKSLRKQILEQGVQPEPVVSEHGLLRYLERVKGINLEDVRQEILNDRVKDQIKVLGGNGTLAAETFSVVMKNNTVVTIT